MNSSSKLPSRRRFLGQCSLLGSAVLTWDGTTAPLSDERPNGLHIACNQYTWQVYFRRENRNFGQSLPEDLAEVAKSGLDGFEPMASSPEQIAEMGRAVKGQGLEMRSLYVNSVLHEEAQAEKSVEQVLAIAKSAREYGTRIIVTNPSPIQWGGEEAKSDSQLRLQARAMNRLGTKLSSMGLKLAYHNHDIELRHAAREFHHMMVGTDPAQVHLCLDAHWIYRGAGDSSVALFDVVKLYGERTVELHVRQSQAGLWSETFGEGDIDYPKLVAELADRNLRPHIVLEQAVEKGTPHTLKPVEAHARSVAYARNIFD